jgi:hypothetical protein
MLFSTIDYLILEIFYIKEINLAFPKFLPFMKTYQ